MPKPISIALSPPPMVQILRAGVVVVVVMLIQRQRALGAQAEHRPIFRGIRHHMRSALAADVPVQTNHPVRRAHHHMQIMADHQHRRAGLTADILDKPVKRHLARLIQPLCRLIEYQRIRRAQQRARQQNALKLPP